MLYILRVAASIQTNLRFQFVAQYLLTTAPTCFGHRMWASSGSYKLHSRIQHILQVVIGLQPCPVRSIYSSCTNGVSEPWDFNYELYPLTYSSYNRVFVF